MFSLQVLRGLAACAVTLYHGHLILSKAHYGGMTAWGPVAGLGWLGVNLFFVLSGFVIAFAHAADVGHPAAAGRYLRRRFTRVYPIYWIFSAVFIAAGLLGAGYPDFRWTTSNMLASATLFWFDLRPLPPLQVAWTLFYEITFYGVFLLLIFNRVVGLCAVALWTAAILVYGLVLGRSEMGPLNMWCIYFILGMAAFRAYSVADRRWAWPALACGLALLAVLIGIGVAPEHIALAEHDPPALLVLAAAFALIIFGATLIERDRTLRWPAWLLLLGDASYSIYLVHSAALSMFGQVRHHVRIAALPDALTLLVAVAFAIGCGLAAHLLVERPLLRAMRMRAGRASRAMPAAAPVEA